MNVTGSTRPLRREGCLISSAANAPAKPMMRLIPTSVMAWPTTRRRWIPCPRRGDTNSDFAGSLRDRVSHDAVDADRGQHQRRARKDRQQQGLNRGRASERAMYSSKIRTLVSGIVASIAASSFLTAVCQRIWICQVRPDYDR